MAPKEPTVSGVKVNADEVMPERPYEMAQAMRIEGKVPRNVRR